MGSAVYRKKLGALLRKQHPEALLVVVVHDTDEAAESSLRTLLLAHYTDVKLKILLFWPANADTRLQKLFSDFDTEIKTYETFPTPLDLASQTTNGSGFVVFTSTYMVFHPDWFNQMRAAFVSAAGNDENILIAGASSFNPNDFTLLKTLSTHDNYVVKDDFSRHCIMLPAFNALNTMLVSNGQKHFLSGNIPMCFAFTAQSYADVHTYGVEHPHDIKTPVQNNLSFATSRVKEGWDRSLVGKLPRLNRLIIQVNYGGLGDNLFMSHLPRIAKQFGGYEKVYVSEKSVFRHPDYKRLIWDTNPFVDGYTDEPGYFIEFLKFDTEAMNILAHIMLLFGLDDGERHHEPELYFKPVLKPELSGKTIYDPNYVSDAGDKFRPDDINTFFESMGIRIDYQMQKRDKSVSANVYGDWLASTSLEDFCSIIASCERLFCFASGTATLAAALGQNAHVFYEASFNPQFLHSKNNVYIKI